MDLHDGLIAGHVAGGAVAIVLGLAVLIRRRIHPTLLSAYVLALVAMAAFVVAAVAVDWAGLSVPIQIVFAALLALAAYTVWRGWHARASLLTAQPSTMVAMEDAGFTLIALITGFVIILARDLGASIWLVASVCVIAIATGAASLELRQASAFARRRTRRWRALEVTA